MSGGGWSLQPCGDAELGFLHGLAATVPERWPRVCRRGLPDPHRFAEAVWAGVVLQVVIAHGDELVGVASLHDHAPAHGTAWLDAVVLPGDELEAGRARAAGWVAAQGFDRWSLRAVYESHRSVDGSALAAAGLLVEQQACLREHWLHDGIRWDRIVTRATP